ncbi:uncharacterized protein LOC134762455 [Penaeus indicus]|uniref:uncharacterized protein LOC134762455 n=1 Tax=Penaeus indicus TaxID=29960 RepID=UPI00300CC260
MFRFLRSLFSCCFPEVEDEVDTDWGRPSDAGRSPTDLFGSITPQATTPHIRQGTTPYIPQATTPYIPQATTPYSITSITKREILASKYRGHPSLSLHFGSRDLEEVIKDNGGRPLLDLHGMTVREAKEWVEYFINLHEDLGTDSINVVTGRGNNSADGKAKIKPAIEKLLGELGLQYREMNKGGSFWVQL